MSIELKRFFCQICSETLLIFFQFLNFIPSGFGVAVHFAQHVFHNEMYISISEQYPFFRTKISQANCHFVIQNNLVLTKKEKLNTFMFSITSQGSCFFKLSQSSTM